MSKTSQQLHTHIPDKRTYAFHLKAAEILLTHPERLNEVHDTLNNWTSLDGTQAQGWAIKWIALIDGLNASEVAKLITQKNEQMDFFRKSSPFAGVLSEEERLSILQKHRFNYE